MHADRAPSGRRMQSLHPKLAIALGVMVFLSLIVSLVARSLL